MSATGAKRSRRYFKALRWFLSAWFLFLAEIIAPNSGMYRGSLAEAAEYAGQRTKDALDGR